MTTPKFIFTYDPNGGAALTDGQVRGYADMLIASAIATGKIDVVVGVGNVFDVIRMAIMDGKLPYTETVFKFKDQTLILNEYGNPISGFPEGFCGLEMDLVTELLDKQYQLSKARKEAKNGNPSN